jgi:SAM-dependent methyltransferase
MIRGDADLPGNRERGGACAAPRSDPSGSAALRYARAASERALRAAGWTLVKAADRFQTGPALAGDRTVEWAWMLSRLRRDPGRVLDFGAGTGFLSLAAALAGHDVVAVDLEPNAFEFEGMHIVYRQGDFNELDFELRTFDQVLNCSTIEHVGLAGRYGSPAESEGDLRAMEKLAGLVRPEGDMVLTLPVGLDGVFPPYHRVYGAERLPRLLEPFSIRDEGWWAKLDGRRWEPVAKETALSVQGSSSYYALGLFVLAPQ